MTGMWNRTYVPINTSPHAYILHRHFLGVRTNESLSISENVMFILFCQYICNSSVISFTKIRTKLLDSLINDITYNCIIYINMYRDTNSAEV